MTQSTSQAARWKSDRGDRPRKPRPDFPLFPHATGRWAKKVRGRFAFFGKVADDPDGSNALDLWLEQRDDLLAGRKPRVKGEGLTLAALANAFLTAKQALRDSGELASRTWGTYYSTCERVLSEFGKHRLATDLDVQDFGRLRSTLANNLGPVALGNEIQRVRSLFKFGFDSGLIAAPVRFGPLFQKPSKKTIRLARQENGERMLEAVEIRRMLTAAGEPLHTMLLLGINCAFGNGDIGTLPINAIDLHGNWIIFARKKTGIPRRIPLWEETAKAIRKWLPKRPAPKNSAHDGLVFITKYGRPWARTDAELPSDVSPDEMKRCLKMLADSPVSKETIKLLKNLGLHRRGLGFYTLRHVFQTIGDGARDPVATSHIMGHVDSTMAGQYRERIDDARLKAVTDHVRRWLFPPKKKGSKKAKPR